MRDIGKIFAAFDLQFGRRQDFITFLIHIRNNNIDIDEIIDYFEKLKRVERKKERQREQEYNQWNKNALRCPKCKTMMRLYSVNTYKGDQTGDNSKSQWFCSKCWYDEYSTKTVEEWTKKLIDGV